MSSNNGRNRSASSAGISDPWTHRKQCHDRELEDDFCIRPEATAPYDFVCRSDLSGSGAADVPGDMGDNGDLTIVPVKPALYDALL